MSRSQNITVKYARLGESVQEVVLEAGATTVADFREQYFNKETVKVKRSGQILDDDAELQNGDVLLIANKVEGGL